MPDLKVTNQLARRENERHENARPEIADLKITGQIACVAENEGLKIVRILDVNVRVMKRCRQSPGNRRSKQLEQVSNLCNSVVVAPTLM